MALVAAVTGVIALLEGHTRTSSLAVLYLFAVLPVAVMWGVGYAVVVSVASTAAFDLLFVHSEDWVGLATFLVTAVLVSKLAARLRHQAQESERLADEQAALRRVATLVARGALPEEVFAAVTEEVGRLLATHRSALARYESDDTVTVVATWADDGEPGGEDPLAPARWPLGGGDLSSTIWSVGRPARVDDYRGVQGSIAAFVRDELGLASSVGSPIVVEGRLWGALFVHSKRSQQPLAQDTESRLTAFTKLVAMAIANAASRAELAASRVRIVAATDETRRRIERDLHDGSQQRLVSLALDLRRAEAAVPPEAGELKAQLAKTADGLAGAIEDLREISHGIHPSILSDRGLGPAIRALARRSSLPVEVDVGPNERLPEALETAAYYVVAEALANATKHASASVAHVDLEVRDATLRVSIRDDGVGGADASQGSGLVGLCDRVEALGGTIALTSPRGQGTSMVLEFPVEVD